MLDSVRVRDAIRVLKKYLKFIGPGLMVSVAYMDPGNYSTAVAAGSAYKYKLLFLILLSNCLAIFLQVLSAKLGAVTGLDLAANCRANLPFRLNIVIYVLAEIAIVATDLAEVVGTAIALNILFKLPLFLGVIITVIDVLIVLMAYKPEGPILFIRIFESFVSVLVAATVFCFGIELYQVSHESSINFSYLEVLRGFLPSSDVVDTGSNGSGDNGLYLSLAILGATVMPHSLYLGSGLVQARLKDYDIKNGFFKPSSQKEQVGNGDQDPANTPLVDDADDDADHDHDHNNDEDAEALQVPQIPTTTKTNVTKNADPDTEEDYYRPSIHAINDTMTYTMVELVISLFTVALFVNSAILIVAGATLNSRSKRDSDDTESDTDNDSDGEDGSYEKADLFTIYHLLSKHLSPTAGHVFALALLCSGQSAGVVCTLAGQMVLEGFLSWSIPPVPRRLITRSLAIVPCLVVVSSAGRQGLAQVLNSSQVVLSILLPFVTAPLIWFTCSKNIMKVPIFVRDGDEDVDMLYSEEDGFHDISDILTTDSTATLPRRPKKYKSTEPAIRLNDLRNSHPCAGWDDDEETAAGEEGQHLMQHGSNYTSDTNNSSVQVTSRDHVPRTSQFAYSPQNPSQSEESDTYANTVIDSDQEIYRVKGFKDMSNGLLTSASAILVWGFITCLNIYLIISALLGYDTF